MTTNPTALLAFRRDQFAGKTDKYMPPFSVDSPTAAAMMGRTVYVPTAIRGMLSPDAETTQERLERYRSNARFYKGEQFLNPYEDGEKKPVFNYCQAIVDKGVDWFIAKGWKVVSDANEDIATYLNYLWDSFDRRFVTMKAGKYGAIRGDSYLMVNAVTVDDQGKPLPPDQRKLVVVPLNPQFCFPVFNDENPSELDAILIQYPKVSGDQSFLYSLYITKTKYWVFHDEDTVETGDNSFGMVNVVHIPNFVQADTFFGESDLEPVIPVNKEYNEVALAIRRILKYHSEPTTLIYGIRVSDLERSAKKVWSNLPIDAKVENLELKSDLEASFKYLDRLEERIYHLANTPKIAFDSYKLSVSNTSGLAIQLLFQPLTEKTARRRVGHAAGIAVVNKLLLIGSERFLGVDVAELADDKESLYSTEVEYTSPLPKDEQAELDAVNKKLEMGVLSRAEAMRRISGVRDVEGLIVEVIADERAEIARSFEEAKAASVEKPDLNFALLSSLGTVMDTTSLRLKDEEENRV